MLVQQRNNKKKRVKFAKKFASLETMKTKGEENGLLVYISIKERERERDAASRCINLFFLCCCNFVKLV